MTRVRLLPEAHEKLRAAARYYEAEQPGLGFALLPEVRRNSTSSKSTRRPRVRSGATFASELSRVFPYRIYYRASPEEILIIAVGHRRRRPGFWRLRE